LVEPTPAGMRLPKTVDVDVSFSESRFISLVTVIVNVEMPI